MIKPSIEDRILSELKDGKKSIREMETCLTCNTRTIYRAVNALINEGYINRSNGSYILTQVGMLLAPANSEAIRTGEAVEKYKEYIISHKLDCMPEHLLRGLFLLPDLKVVGNDDDLAWIERFVIDMIKSTEKQLKGITTIVTPEWAAAAYEIAEKGCKITFIVKEDVLNKVRERSSTMLSHPNIKWFVNNEIKFYFCCNGKRMATSFYDHTCLDLRRKLTSSCREADKWGEELFNYFKKRAKRVSPEH